MQDKTDKKRIRSAAYPAFDLETSISFIHDLYKKLGSGPYNRKNAAVALGHTGLTGAAAAKVAALGHFGLLDKSGGAYSLSQLSRRIILQTSDDDKKKAIIDAVRKPTLYSRIVDDYNGGPLPEMLSNVLIHRHQISDKISKAVAKDLEKSFDYAGILKNGIIMIEGNAGSGSELVSLDRDQQEVIAKDEVGLQGSIMKDEWLSIKLNKDLIVQISKRFEKDLAFGKFAKQLSALDDIIGNSNGNSGSVSEGSNEDSL